MSPRTILRAVLLSIPLLTPGLPVLGQPVFTHEALVLSSAAVQDVAASTSGWRLYFIRDGYAVWSATSTDQLSWSVESSTRLGVGALEDADASSITACAVFATTGPLRMYYVGISTSGVYSVLSATSTDGFTWSKEPGVRHRLAGGGYLGSPRPWPVSGTRVDLFYIADSAGGNTPANYRIFQASSSDSGISFNASTQKLSQNAFELSVTTLTDGRTRLYFSNPETAGSTQTTRILSAISPDGSSFTAESDTRLSTAAAIASLGHPVVLRSTETYRWRMFTSYSFAGATAPYAGRSLTITPLLTGLSPVSVLNNQSTAAFTLSGEIFAPTATPLFSQGPNTMPWFSTSWTNDLQITGSAAPLNAALGYWLLSLTNPDGRSGALGNALYVDLPTGIVTLLDNVFRPLKGGQVSITIQIFEAGTVTVNIYTLAGGLVAALFDGPLPQGSTSFLWNGRTAQGSVAASGVYLVRITGPKLKRIEKVVLIK